MNQSDIRIPVSYTHLDVYKRQAIASAALTALALFAAFMTSAKLTAIEDVYKRQLNYIPR